MVAGPGRVCRRVFALQVSCGQHAIRSHILFLARSVGENARYFVRLHWAIAPKVFLESFSDTLFLIFFLFHYA
jgi:hypothetical protein